MLCLQWAAKYATGEQLKVGIRVLQFKCPYDNMIIRLLVMKILNLVRVDSKIDNRQFPALNKGVKI